jgi:hypothetical protein
MRTGADPVGGSFTPTSRSIRFEPGRRWLLEIVGSGRPSTSKPSCSTYRKARIERLILGIDEGRVCADGDLPTGARIVRFRDQVRQKRFWRS